MPDIFIPMDTSSYNRYYSRLRRNNIIYNFVLDYVDLNRSNLQKQYPDFNQYIKNFSVTSEMVEKIIAQGEKEGIERDEASLSFTLNTMAMEIKALIARDIFTRNEFYRIVFQDDDVILKALEVIENKERYRNLLVSAD
jgi:carboxyl-terminal processing protease